MPDAAGLLSTLWHERDLARVARRLHDRVGPALCAAGLQLSLIEQSAKPAPGSDAAEAISGLREALEESTHEVRTLSYLCDPSLVRRLGLKAAIGYLARMVPLEPGELGELGARKDEPAAAAFTVLRQALLFWSDVCPKSDFELAVSSRSLKVISSTAAPDEVAVWVERSGGVVSKDRISVTLKVGKAKGGEPA